jgi:hypothetical protein
MNNRVGPITLDGDNMTDSKKPLEVKFAPGAFDNIDVENQEELDQLMAEITDMFATMSPEDLEAMSRPVDLTDLDDEQRAILENALSKEPKRNLH